jgi:hypothetical protein
MIIYEGREVIETVMDTPQTLSSVIPLLVLEEKFCRFWGCFSEHRAPPQWKALHVTARRHAAWRKIRHPVCVLVYTRL